MIITKSNGLPILSGIVFGLALLFLVDGFLVARGEVYPQHHYSFSMFIPVIFSLVGFALLMLLPPASLSSDDSRAKIVFFIAWLSMFGSTVGALTTLLVSFTGKQTRTRAEPGVMLVIFTALVPVSCSLLWWSRGVRDESDW